MHYIVMETVVRLLPMFISGFLCNLVVGFTAARILLVWLLGALFSKLYSLDISNAAGAGATATTISCLLFAIIVPSTTYWAYAFMAIIASTMGSLVFTTATLFNAKLALPHEQGMFGALINMMTYAFLFKKLSIPVDEKLAQQLGNTVGVTVSSGFQQCGIEKWPGQRYASVVPRCSLDVLRRHRTAPPSASILVRN